MRIAQTASLAALVLSTACTGIPQPTTVPGTNKLPKDWSSLPPDDSRIEMMDGPTRKLLANLQADMAKERNSPYYQFYGHFTPEMQARVAQVNDACNTSALVSFELVAATPNPELSGIAETWNDRTRGQAMVNAVNWRSVWDEWEQAWLMDRPASSAFPLVNTAGQP